MARIAALSAGGSFGHTVTMRDSSGPSGTNVCASLCASLIKLPDISGGFAGSKPAARTILCVQFFASFRASTNKKQIDSICFDAFHARNRGFGRFGYPDDILL